jgi:hypothetical protein
MGIPQFSFGYGAHDHTTTALLGIGVTSMLLAETSGVTAQPVARVAQSQTAEQVPLETIGTIVGRFGGFSKYKYAIDVVRRLLELDAISEEEGITISLGSLKQLLRFLDANVWIAAPEVVISTAGNMRCQWSRGDRQHFVIEFFSSGDVHFVVFAPNEQHINKVTRVSGACTQDMVFRYADSYQVRSWVSSGG